MVVWHRTLARAEQPAASCFEPEQDSFVQLSGSQPRAIGPGGAPMGAGGGRGVGRQGCRPEHAAPASPPPLSPPRHIGLYCV